MIHLNPDYTQSFFEFGSALFQIKNVIAIRKHRTIKGVHWLPTAFFAIWGVYNLWFYLEMGLPLAWWAGLAITLVNMVWLSHAFYYLRKEAKS